VSSSITRSLTWSRSSANSRTLAGDRMWFRNRLVRPVVRLLLRSPVHRLLSGSLVLRLQGRDLEGAATPSSDSEAARPAYAGI
jgi:hypothetical protein